jgi:flagellar motor switch protein FliG
MSPQLQQVLADRDRLSSTEQSQVIEYINTRQRSSVLETIANLRSQQPSFKTP